LLPHIIGLPTMLHATNIKQLINTPGIRFDATTTPSSYSSSSFLKKQK
jgi:hypothetical protein